MQISSVVAEFNPFHNGHEHLINTVKTNKDTLVVAVMSGNFVQRGEPAIISKFARAKAAVLCGADLVLDDMLYPSAPALDGIFEKLKSFIMSIIEFIKTLLHI